MKRTLSLKCNMALNAFKSILNIIFPLITFPYASKILGIDNIGKYNFSSSIVSYFVLFSELGISTYAIREGAKIRKSELIKTFSNEMFSINILSTLISYILLGISLIYIPKFQEYNCIILILSISILFRTIGMEWIYSIYEDYLYITIRSIVIQVLSLVLLFVFVKSKDDLLYYSFLSVFSGAFTGILNFVHARKYCKIHFTLNMNCKKHLKPILVLFGMSATVTIYVSSDTTILGFMCSDKIVGQYAVSVKIYTIVKTILSSVLVVSIPRISAILSEHDKIKLNMALEDIYKTLLTFLFPAIIGLIILRRSVILFISSEEFIGATSSLVLLAIALFFCMGAWFWGQCVLVPLNEEVKVFKVTVVSAVINIVLNLLLIPFWKENAAALTTIIAEAISYFYCMYCGRKQIGNLVILRTVKKISVGSIGILLVCGIVRFVVRNEIWCLACSIILSIVVYIVIEIILNNEVIGDFFLNITKNRGE